MTFHKFMENSILPLVILFCSKAELCRLSQKAPSIETVGSRETPGSRMCTPSWPVSEGAHLPASRWPSKSEPQRPVRRRHGSGSSQLPRGRARDQSAQETGLEEASFGENCRVSQGIGWSAASVASGPQRVGLDEDTPGAPLGVLLSGGIVTPVVLLPRKSGVCRCPL